MTATHGQRCTVCGARFATHGPPNELHAVRCPCSPEKPLEVCSSCVASRGVAKGDPHETWCSVEHADGHRKAGT